MGNKLSRRRQVVDEKYTRPQGLYQHRDVDHRKLRKLILDSKLAPCYPGKEELAADLEECPICFLYYPSLNRSRCCMKGICTECFLQMRPPHSTRPTQCPFCKTSNYAVEYRGIKSKEEKGKEQVEEQKVIEAKIRIRQQELQEEEERLLRRQEICSNFLTTPGEAEHRDVANSSIAVRSFSCSAQGDNTSTAENSCRASSTRHSPHLIQSRDDDFDLDLEDIMVMEAIWLSVQEHVTNRNGVQYTMELSSQARSETRLRGTGESSPSGGLALAIAALAEHQLTEDNAPCSEPSLITSVPVDDLSPASDSVRQHEEEWIEVSPHSGRAAASEVTEWTMDHKAAEVGTSYVPTGLPTQPYSDHAEHYRSVVSGSILPPESFEEQMMLAMAVSLTEARARQSSQGVAWL